MASRTETVKGKVKQLLFSPKGGVEGLLLEADDKNLQLSLESGSVDARVLAKVIGKSIEATGTLDTSEKTKHGEHPVYELDSITKVAGKAFSGMGETTELKGIVERIHYARHGEPNGVVLDGGEFIHLRPAGMKKLDLQIGAKVVATGEIRMTVLGNVLLEADTVNRVRID